MNPFSIVILAALLCDFALGLVANLLNLKSLGSKIPPEFDGIYEPEDYRNSQEYTRVSTRLGFASSAYQLIILLALWFSSGFNYLDQAIRVWDIGPIGTGLCFIGILLIANMLLDLPFSIYGTFVIEERFGFNRTTARTFVIDRIKGLALTIVIAGPLLACVLALFEYAGNYAWLLCWIVITVFSLAMQFIAPTWIMPLFNKFAPMEPGELKDAIVGYAKSVDFPLKNVFVMDGSKRSTKSNAFFTGFGRNKRIALFDTLIAKHSVQELVAILAHEIGHYKKKHILQGMFIGVLHTGVLLFLLSVFLNSNGLYEAFFMEEKSIYTGLLFFGLLYTPIELILGIFMQMLSRKNEYTADRFAAQTIDDPQSLIEALKKLSTTNLSNLTPHRFYVFLNYSHPPLRERVQAITGIIQQMPAAEERQASIE